MPRTRKRDPGPRSERQPLPMSANGLSGDVLTLPEAAEYLRLSQADVVELVHVQGLPGRSIAREWRFLKTAIQQWLASASPTWEVRKAAILELAGKYKQDPDLEQIVEDAYRQRGRQLTEETSSKNLSD
jgi:excisionase family DNA binding protein